MPHDYAEAGERVKAELKRAGKLSDPISVGQKVLQEIAKRAKQPTSLAQAFAFEADPDYEDFTGAAGAWRKPPGWVPNYAAGEYCAGCPHKEGCFSNPNITPKLPDEILTDHAKYDRLAARREKAAEGLSAATGRTVTRPNRSPPRSQPRARQRRRQRSQGRRRRQGRRQRWQGRW